MRDVVGLRSRRGQHKLNGEEFKKGRWLEKRINATPLIFNEIASVNDMIATSYIKNFINECSFFYKSKSIAFGEMHFILN